MSKADLIDRQAAIDAAIEAINEWGGGWDVEREARDAINALPSVQIDGDYISRQAALDAVVAWTVEDRPDIEMPTDLVGRIKALPSAQPEIIRCKECGKREVCRTSTVWAVPPKDNWYCADAERRRT